MDIDRYERWWIYISAVVLIVLMASLLYSVYGLDIRLATDVGQVNPMAVAQTPPFDNPGVKEVEPGHYEAVLVARAWSFEPAEIRVPVDSTVTFLITSADVIHGLRIPRTAINRMLIPGQVAQVRHRFREPGEYHLFCHEYCGIGHHTMNGRIVVEPR